VQQENDLWVVQTFMVDVKHHHHYYKKQNLGLQRNPVKYVNGQ
jgi:hypothetical protein